MIHQKQKNQSNPLQLVLDPVFFPSFLLFFSFQSINHILSRLLSVLISRGQLASLTASLLFWRPPISVTSEWCSMTAGIEGVCHSSKLRNPERSKRVSKQVRYYVVHHPSQPSHFPPHSHSTSLSFSLSLPFSAQFNLSWLNSINSIPS